MIVGHAFVAFAIGALAASRLGASRDRALRFGLVAGAFAVVPDVDLLAAVAGLVVAHPAGVWTGVHAFWDASKGVHRAVTHSLVVAVSAALGVALAAGRRGRRLAAVPLAGLVALGWSAGGALDAAVLGTFVVAGVSVAWWGTRLGLGRRAVLLAALLGLMSHPFGDLFTGTPPPLFFPLGPAVFGHRVTLLADPTLNLLAVFGLELGTVWLGTLVAGRLLDWSVVDAIDRRAALGALYGAAVLVLPPPTMAISYPFVFSVVAVGAVGVVPLAGRFDRRAVARAAATGLAAITLAGGAYALGYALV